MKMDLLSDGLDAYNGTTFTTIACSVFKCGNGEMIELASQLTPLDMS